MKCAGAGSKEGESQLNDIFVIEHIQEILKAAGYNFRWPRNNRQLKMEQYHEVRNC